MIQLCEFIVPLFIIILRQGSIRERNYFAMIKITSLGGSGEDSRNCFYVQGENVSFLLDCGVRREIADVSVVYPLLTEKIARSLDAVFLSHAHEDHTAALPYLYELGYRGPVYASAETIRMTPTFLQKWADYVKKNGGRLPFDEENIQKIRFEPIGECPLKGVCGRDGHIIGGLWYRFDLGGRSLLYTGDLTYDSLLLEADPLPEADVLIIDGAYADRHLDQQVQYGKLAETARQVVSAGGKLLLPVPANGRGIDMFVYLSRFDLPLFAEPGIVKNTADLARNSLWVKDFDLPPADRYTAVSDVNRAELLGADRCGVFLFGDGMMTSTVSAEYFAAVREDSRSRIIISGHSAKGTLVNRPLQEDFRLQNGIKAGVEQLTVKVHNDAEDVLGLAGKVRPGSVMLFHCKAAGCAGLAEQLSAKGIAVTCGVGQTLIIEN